MAKTNTGNTSQDPIQVSLLTGFLGSGKTTLLNQLLKHPEMLETAVLINEFGEIGLDHELIERVDENTVLLNDGCLCCTVQGDLVNALSKLYLQRIQKKVPHFQRVLIETTGLADPAPIIHTLMNAPLVSDRYALDGIISTVDAVNGETILNKQLEPVKQVAVADRIVITKSDLSDKSSLKRLENRLSTLNPGAPKEFVIKGKITPNKLLDTGLYDPKTKTVDVQRWLRDEAYNGISPTRDDLHHEHTHDINRHDDSIISFCITRDKPLDWEAFVAWIRILIGKYGEQLLRIKGILNISGRSNPIAIHGVQHLFHDPIELSKWESDDRRSRLVFITRDLERRVIEEKLESLIEQAETLDS